MVHLMEPRKQLSLNKPPETVAEHPQFPVGDIDFLSEWSYKKLCEYREGLINSIASMEAQLVRSEFRKDTKPDWLYSITFLKTKAGLMLTEVRDRIAWLESRQLGPAIARAADQIFEGVDLADLMLEVEKIMDQGLAS